MNCQALVYTELEDVLRNNSRKLNAYVVVIDT